MSGALPVPADVGNEREAANNPDEYDEEKAGPAYYPDYYRVAGGE